LGTKNLLDTLREKLETEGVGVASSTSEKVLSIQIEPVQEKIRFDIALPITKQSLTHNVKTLDALDPDLWAPIYEEYPTGRASTDKAEDGFCRDGQPIHQVDIAAARLPLAQELIGSITNKVMTFAKLQNVFSQLYPIVRRYIADRCFGSPCGTG